MKLLQKLIILVSLFLVPAFVLAQGTISGTVTDAQTGDPLPGANVVVVGTSFGAAADAFGEFEIVKVPVGSYEVKATFIGYEITTKSTKVKVGESVVVDFPLEQIALMSEAIEIAASRAVERKTPVAFSNVKKADIENQLGSRDIPMALNTTPSVYATQQGGGAGDARVNVRGFNQRNVAVMINGVPVNDMENGWVYWSNWDGVGDAAESIQVQRGLSAVNLATPSIGGTMNIITDPTKLDAGGIYKQELGDAAFLKSTLTLNSGTVADKFAFSGTAVRKTGDGVVDKTWTDAWAYHLAASYQINTNNRIELYALGAPQRHGQNRYRQNIGTYSHEYAEGLDSYDVENGFSKFIEKGYEFNQNWSPISSSYNGKQAWNGKIDHDRYNEDYLNEIENFFHKPQVNLNWFSKLTDQLGLYSIVYYSGGAGGGSGTLGDVYTRDAAGELGDDNYKYYYGPSPWYRDWDATVEMNSGPAGDYYVDKKKIAKADGQSIGILRNSRNNQWTMGAISKLNYKLNDNIQMVAGVDWRTAEIEHYREVRDLLGGSYYADRSDDFSVASGSINKGLGQKVDYNNTNTVDWIGSFAQVEYSKDLLTVYSTVGYSSTKYGFTDFFSTAEKTEDGDPIVGSGELIAESDWISGYQVKGGANYRYSENVDIYGNVGWVNKVPIFDNVIDDSDGSLSESPEDEKFASYEVGVNYHSIANKLSVKTSLYYTTWKDRASTEWVRTESGDGNLIFLTGMDLLHKGLEVEAAFQPTKLFRLDAAASFGRWNHTNDVSGTYKNYTNNGVETEDYNFYVNDLKIGDSPQTQITMAASVYPMRGLSARLVMKNYMDFYADWDAFDRTNAFDRSQSWEVPTSQIFDIHAAYTLPVKYAGVKAQVFAHIFNIMDENIIQDATDNSRYNALDKNHNADDAEVFFGLPRTFNLGVKLTY